MAFLDFLFGSKPKTKSTLDKNQQQMFQEYMKGIQSSPTYQGGNNYLQNLFSNEPGAFEAFEQPYKTQFEQQTVPLISERFAGSGTGAGALNSSGFQQTLAQAGRGLSENLAQQRGYLQQNALGSALNYAQQPFTNLLNGINVNTQERQPGNPGFLQGLFGGGIGGGGGASGAGNGAGALFQMLLKALSSGGGF